MQENRLLFLITEMINLIEIGLSETEGGKIDKRGEKRKVIQGKDQETAQGVDPDADQRATQDSDPEANQAVF